MRRRAHGAVAAQAREKAEEEEKKKEAERAAAPPPRASAPRPALGAVGDSGPSGVPGDGHHCLEIYDFDPETTTIGVRPKAPCFGPDNASAPGSRC